MKRDVHIAKHAVVSAALACDSLQCAKDSGPEKKLTSTDIDELSDDIGRDISLSQIENLSLIVNRAIDRHPLMLLHPHIALEKARTEIINHYKEAMFHSTDEEIIVEITDIISRIRSDLKDQRTRMA